MKKSLRLILILLSVTACSLHAAAVEPHPHDTVYFYDSWQQMLDGQPEEMLIDPMIDAFSAYELYFASFSKIINNRIENKHIALSMGDSIWLVNSNYLNKFFKSDDGPFNGYIPVFFNDKVAYFTYHASLSAKEIIFGVSVGDNGEYLFNVDYFYIDFLNHRVERVTHDYLSLLLEDYHDLQMRYEGMKDYKKRPIIEDFFLKYVDRATEDVMRPYIVDLVGEAPMSNEVLDVKSVFKQKTTN